MSVLATKTSRIFRKICVKDLKLFFIIYTLTFIVLLVICTTFLQHSVFYIKSKDLDSAKHKMKLINDERISESQKVLNSSRKNGILTNNPQNHIDIGLTIIAVARNKDDSQDTYRPKYLTQVVGKLLTLLLSNKTLKTYSIFLCNVDSDPEKFDELKSLSKLFTTFQRFASKTRIYVDKFEKEKQDYLYCMNETLARNVTYTLLIEDDAYPHNDLLTVLEYILINRIENIYSNPRIPERNVTYIKLYHVPAVLGYCSYEVERIPELIGFSLFFGTIFFQLYLYYMKEIKLKVHYIWMLSVIYVSVIAMCVGRQHLLEFRRFSKYLYVVTPTPSCCTPAMLYTRSNAMFLMEKMSKVKCKAGYGKDTLLDDIRRKNKLTALMVQPSLFSHIGHYSTLRNKHLNLDSIL